MYYKLFFETEEKAKAFIEEINGLGYEWNPVRLYRPEKGIYQDAYCLEFNAMPKVFKDIERYYFGSGS